MSMFITGASQTMIPIIGVCLGEKDYDGVRYAFRRAARVLAVSSVVIMLFICIEPEPIIKFFGITSPTDIANTVPAMRINALSFPGLSFSFLLLYYYMATQKRAISTAISIINGIVILIPSALILGKFFGITGVWYSLVVAQVGTLVVVYFIDLAEKRKSGGKYKNFYLLEETEDNELLALSFKGTKENAAGVSLYLSSFLSKNGIEESRANRIAVAVEEMAASCAERMEGKKKFADIDIRIFADKKETIISVRDNGDEFDPLNDDKEFEMSPLTVVKAISDKVEYSRALGFNRTIIKL
jgi:Na+-driven multidrug efflux pump